MKNAAQLVDEKTELQLLEGSIAFFPSLITAIDSAEKSIQLETYIFDFTASGAHVAQALERAAQRGVQVRVMVDGFGTPAFPDEWKHRFKSAGIECLVYEPMVTLGIFLPSQWRRLHRKLCVVDSAVAYCGGINLLDDWHDLSYGKLTAPRFDFCVRVNGALAKDIQMATSQLWERRSSGKSVNIKRMKSAIETIPSVLKRHHWQASAQTGKTLAALVLRDNITNRGQIERAYLKAIGDAHQEIIIANAYFVPGAKLRRALILAAKRGVKVQLLLQGKYEYFMQYHAARPVYGALLAAGIDIYEYDKSYLHAKVAVIDGVWATVGSSNLDPLSLLLAREANIVIQDAAFAQSLRQRLLLAMANEGKRVDAVQMANRPWSQRINELIAFAVMRMGLWLFGKRY
ncbi:MAG: cardiolipin synthase ClsB [Pseudomonadota bacterium]|jgi:cardiolipin synthase